MVKTTGVSPTGTLPPPPGCRWNMAERGRALPLPGKEEPHNGKTVRAGDWEAFIQSSQFTESHARPRCWRRELMSIAPPPRSDKLWTVSIYFSICGAEGRLPGCTRYTNINISKAFSHCWKDNTSVLPFAGDTHKVGPWPSPADWTERA